MMADYKWSLACGDANVQGGKLYVMQSRRPDSIPVSAIAHSKKAHQAMKEDIAPMTSR